MWLQTKLSYILDDNDKIGSRVCSNIYKKDNKRVYDCLYYIKLIKNTNKEIK